MKRSFPLRIYSLATRGKRDANSEEVHRLRRQLKKSKESRRVIVEQHDVAINRLERAKEVGLVEITVHLCCTFKSEGATPQLLCFFVPYAAGSFTL